MNRNEITSFVKEKLIEQGGPSFVENDVGLYSCRYRGPDGKRCAAGWLIPDDKYREFLEEKSARALVVEAALKDSGILEEDMDLVSELQAIHDSYVNSYNDEQSVPWSEYITNKFEELERGNQRN